MNLEKMVGKKIIKSVRKEYNRSLLNVIRLHFAFNMQLTKMVFIKSVYSLWFSFLYFMSKFSKKILCKMVGMLYENYERGSEKTNVKVYAGRDKFDNGHSKICRASLHPTLPLDEEEWQRVTDGLQRATDECETISSNLVKEIKSIEVSCSEPNENLSNVECEIDLNYLKEMMDRAKKDIKSKINW